MSFDGIVHLAAAGVHPADREVASLVDGNVGAPVAVVQLASQLQARFVVVAGSSAEYAQTRAPRLDEHATLEQGALYGATKAAGGLLALSVATTLGVPCAVLRLFNVFGPGEAPHRLLPTLHRNLKLGQAVALSAGTQIRDFVHIDDACRAIMLAMRGLTDASLAPGAYNVATGIGHSVREFALAVGDAMGKSSGLLEFGALPMRPDDRHVVVGDASAFHAATGWTPAVPFAVAVDRAVDELNCQGSVKGCL
jgi:GDP-4-dehydro-6-deoxy-D-mannose reductase